MEEKIENENDNILTQWQYKYTPIKHTIEKKDLKDIKKFLLFLKSYGFKRVNKKEFIMDNYGISMNDMMVYFFIMREPKHKETDIDSQDGFIIKFTLKSQEIISFFLNDKNDMKNLDIKLEKLKSDIQKELKNIVRKKRIEKLL